MTDSEREPYELRMAREEAEGIAAEGEQMQEKKKGYLHSRVGIQPF